MSDRIVIAAAQARAIAAGKKTQHRHPARHDPDMRYRRCPFTIGDPITIRALGDNPDDPDRLTVEVVAFKLQTLREMTFPDVRAEGHKTTIEFMRDWLARHDRSYLDTFEDSTVEHRFRTRHAHRAVWVLTIAPAEQRRYLAARPDSIEAPYTTNPLRAVPGEPETVSDAELAKIITDAQARERVRLDDRWIAARKKLEAELAVLDDMDHARVRDRVKLIRRNLRAIDDMLRRDAA